MCIVCVEINKGKMTTTELRRAIGEIDVKPQHRDEVEQALSEREQWEMAKDETGV